MRFLWNMETVGAIAPKQHGKTTIAKNYLSGVPKDRIYIMDTNHEYDGYPNRYIPKEYSIRELNNFIIACRRHHGILVVLDDVDLFINSRSQENELKNLLINGSHQNIGVIYSAKRVQAITKLLFSETKHLFVGPVWNHDDAYFLRDAYPSWKQLKNLERFQFLYRDRDSREEKIITTQP